MKYFETIKIDKAKVYHLSYHQKRIYNTIGKKLSFTLIPPDNENLYRAKVIYDENEIIAIEYHLYQKKHITTFTLVEVENFDYSKKYLDRTKIDKLVNGYEEIIIINNGYISDTSIANIAFFDHDQWITPSTPLLAGTTRKRYLDKGVLVEKKITKEDLSSFSQMALLNAMVDFDIIPKIVYTKDTIVVK